VRVNRSGQLEGGKYFLEIIAERPEAAKHPLPLGERVAAKLWG
jgi:hypothetical protein